MKRLFAHTRASASALFRPANPGEWCVAVLLSANLVWTSLCLGGVRAETMAWSWALTGVTLALSLALAALHGVRPHRASWVFAPFLICAAANLAFVTPVRWLGARDWLHWAQLFAVFWIALNGLRRERPRRLVLAVIALLGVTAVVLACHQFAVNPKWLMMGRSQAGQYVGRAAGFFGNPNTLAAFFVLLLPAALGFAWRRGFDLTRRLACGYIAAALLLGLVFTMSRGGLLALAAALILWPWFVKTWRVRRRALTCGAVVLATALGALALWTGMPSARERLQELAHNHGERSRPILWAAALKMTADAPAAGTGAGSFNVVFEKYRPEGFRDEPQWAHNDFLNILSDYGISGFVLFLGGALALAFFGRSRVRLAPHVVSDEIVRCAAFARGLGVGLAGLGFACLVDFHLHIPAVGMVAAVFAAEYVKRRETLVRLEGELMLGAGAGAAADGGAAQAVSRSVRLVFCGAAVIVPAFAFLVVQPVYRAEAARAEGRELIDSLAALKWRGADAVPVRTAVLKFREAVRLDPDNAQAWADLSYAQSLLTLAAPSRAKALGREAGIYARKALSKAPVVSEFWIRLGVALDIQGRRGEAGDAFARALRLAPANAFAWYHQAYHLSLAPATRALALGAVETCLRLDPGCEDADTLRAFLNAAR